MASHRSVMQQRRRKMILRCYDNANEHYANYGGRGIRVCDRWIKSLDAFIEDMGPMPTPQHTIERMDNDGNYEPSNCRWATRAEQQLNRRSNRRITAFGRTQTVTEWSREFGINLGTLRARLRVGIDPETAIGQKAVEVCGSAHGNSKLTESDVRYIRANCKKYGDKARLARMFNVNQGTIGKIVRRIAWKQVA